ncbi:polyprenyl diphosphate synthase [Brachybacterium tyrofermentans]|uniref:polyprenyl diphosphate synthase n=1 Tax=Brachybacterium tyrofermentans TaxID=47848 RepID=UPI003F93F6F3
MEVRDASSRPAPLAAPRPRHIGVIMDGNRRWAKAQRHVDVGFGHKAGAEHLSNFMAWLSARDIDHASAYVLSADNIRKRDSQEVRYLFTLIEEIIPHRVKAAQSWQLHVRGDLDLLPAPARAALERAIQETADRPRHLTLAIGYDAHANIVSAVQRAILHLNAGELDGLTVDAVSEQLAGGPVKDIDLIIRTGGDSRTSGFFPWQTKSAELYVVQHPWPAFSESDLDDALSYYATKRGRATT